MKLTALLIDDEYASSEVLKYEIEQLDEDIHILGIYEDPVKGLQALKNDQPDLVFLDIEMPKLNGFEVLDLLGHEHSTQVIFVTAFNKYAVEAFQYYAVDYLVKPVIQERLSSAIKKVKSTHRKITAEQLSDIKEIVSQEIDIPEKIVVPISSGFQMIKVSSIIRCEANNNYTSVLTIEDVPLLVSKSLIHFVKLLQAANFLRVHQSHLVNMEYVTQYIKSDGGHLVMCEGSTVPVSRGQKTNVTQYFKSKSI